MKKRKLTTKPKERYVSCFMAEVVANLRQEGRMGTAHIYQSTCNRVNEFMQGRPLAFSDVTPEWLSSFQMFLLARQLRWNTVSTYMRMLRAVYFRAVDAGIAPYRSRLFNGVYTGTERSVKRAVGADVFRRLQEPLSTDHNLESARMLFLLLFMLRGIPFVDIAFMRRCDLNGDVISYRRRKTGSSLTVRVEPKAMELIRQLQNKDKNSPYLFPCIQCPGSDEYRQYQRALRTFNYRLYKMSKLLGDAGLLSSYTARHSWATIANYQNYQTELISNAMGHSSVKVTETYFKKHTDERIDEMNRGILSYVFEVG